jgi:hypothetical protein
MGSASQPSRFQLPPTLPVSVRTRHRINSCLCAVAPSVGEKPGGSEDPKVVNSPLKSGAHSGCAKARALLVCISPWRSRLSLADPWMFTGKRPRNHMDLTGHEDLDPSLPGANCGDADERLLSDCHTSSRNCTHTVHA